MKFVFLLTLLLATAFADVSTTIPADVLTVITNFISTLPVSSTAQKQITTGIAPCFAAYVNAYLAMDQYVNTLATTLSSDEKNKNKQTYTGKLVKEQILPNCSNVYNPILQYLQSSKTSKIDNINYYIITFFQTEVALAITDLAQTIMSSTVTSTNTQAYQTSIFQKFSNILKLIAANPNAKFPTVPIPFRPDVFVREFVTSFLLEFGANPTVINSITFCLLDLVNSIDWTQSIYLNPAQNLQGAIQRCEASVVLPSILNSNGSMILNSISFSPQNLVNLISNQMTRNPAIIQYYVDLGSHISSAQYRLAGKDLAHMVQSLLMSYVLNQQ